MLTLSPTQIAGLDATAQAMLRAVEGSPRRPSSAPAWSLLDSDAPTEAEVAFATAGMEASEALVMRLLLPAFRATASVLQQTHRPYETFDALGQPVVVTTVDGRTAHRTPAFEALLAHEANALSLTAAISTVARAAAHAATGMGGAVEPVFQKVHTSTQRYTLRAALTTADVRTASVVVTVMPEAAALPTPEALAARFNLTRREAEVALLLAEGLPNDDLAERLFISPHTARRHTERVLAKLGVATRGAVARRLLDA